MNTATRLIWTAAAAGLTLFASAAVAQEASPDYPAAQQGSTLTRAQVQAELAEAKRTGALRVYSTSYNHMAAAKSLKTREQVRNEVLAERRGLQGNAVTSVALTGEDSGSFALARAYDARVAQPVLAAR
jgi:hypothetical protein